MRLLPQGSILIFHQKFLIPWNICRNLANIFCHLLGNTVNQTDGSNDNSNANMLLLKLQYAPPATQDEENEIFNYLSVEGRAEVLKNFKGLGIQQLSP